MKMTVNNKKTAPLETLIDFFASLYDLGYDCINLSIDFFASLYDMVYNLFNFIWEYLKWVTTIESVKSNEFTIQAKESIQVDNQNPFGIR